MTHDTSKHTDARIEIPHALDRRSMLKRSAATAALLGAAPLASGATREPNTDRKRAIRVAHLTDTHVQPERRAREGLEACLAHVQSLSDTPELILTGGDHIMDSFKRDEARTKLQWGIYTDSFRDGCSIPAMHALGNHDIWGWHRKKSKTTGDEPMWGKKWALEQLGMSSAFHSFDRAGWHFVCLDSVDHDPNDPDGYIGRLGAEQLDWLDRDLASVPKGTPVLVLSHIPILTVTGMLGASDEQTNNYTCRGGTMHADSEAIRACFAKHANVRLCLSGHTHRLDRVEFQGVTYLCNGAVSGNWWKGKHFEVDEGYAVLDLYRDGSFDCAYTPFGWVAEG